MAQAARNYYEVLGVGRDASAQEIQRAYRKLARRYHPDQNRGVDAGGHFQELSTAYEVLHDPHRRARYDRSAAERGPRPLSGARVPCFLDVRPAREVPRFEDENAPSPGLRLPLQLVVRLGVFRWPR